MKIKIIQLLFYLSSISKIFSRLKCVTSLTGGLLDSCYAKDVNNIAYVSKCKKGKICMNKNDMIESRSINNLEIFQNVISDLNLGQCVPFPMPLFIDDACVVNEECASKNCDGGKCKEPEFCTDDLQCDYGKFCDCHRNYGRTYKCIILQKEGNPCADHNDCGKFMLCHKEKNSRAGLCTKIGSIANGNFAIDDMLCKTGYRNINGYCKEITENTICNENDKATIYLDDDNSVDVECKKIDIDDSYYPNVSRSKIEAFYDYKNLLDEEYDEMENDDVMWNWNNNRFHGDNKELKLKYFFYLHPEFYGKYDNFDDEMDCIIDYLRQKELNISINKISKLLLLLFTLFLI